MAEQSTKPLTDLAIKRMTSKTGVLVDAGCNRGLRVTCGSTGKKSFIYRFRDPLTGKLSQIKLGDYPKMTLSEARVSLAKMKELRGEGVSLRAFKKSSLIKNTPEIKPITIRDLVEHYLRLHIEDGRNIDGSVRLGARKKKGQQEVRRTLEADPVKILGSRTVETVASSDLRELVMTMIANRGANVQAGMMLREMSAAYDFGIGTGLLNEDLINPAEQAKAMLKRAKIKLTSSKRTRALDDREIASLLKWLPTSDYTRQQQGILMMVLWTGCRSGEVCAAKWGDIDFDRQELKIIESKNKTDRDVQLPEQAIVFLREIKSLHDIFIFQSSRSKQALKQKNLTEKAWQLRVAGNMLDIKAWTPHDLRRTVRTGLSRLKCPSDVAEAILGHSPKGIEGTYNLHDYKDECREWLQKWANHLDSLNGPGLTR